jgi:hypothetical protein
MVVVDAAFPGRFILDKQHEPAIVHTRGIAAMKDRVPTSKLRHFRKADEGQALVLTALALVVLMLMAGLGVDVGYLRYQKQQMQKAADAGVMAGATEFIYGGKWKAAAFSDAAANGFQNGINGILVTPNYPPQTPGDPFQGNRNYVEVIVAQAQPTFFMRVLNHNTVPVSARALASVAGAASGCIYVLDPLASASFKAAGTIVLSSACGIRVDSSDPGAYTDNGGACVEAANGISVHGGVANPGPGCSTVPQAYAAPFPDPLAGLTEPTPGTCTTQSGKITGGTVTLNPGTFCGGIQISGSNPNVTFTPGLYILYGGGMSINAQATVTGNGVTFYNTGTAHGSAAFGRISINGGSGISLSAPINNNDPTGAIEAILFFENRDPAVTGGSQTNNTINGTSGSFFDGALYFKSTSLNYSGSSTSGGYSIIVADQISITGTTTVNDNYSSLADGPPIKSAVVAE